MTILISPQSHYYFKFAHLESLISNVRSLARGVGYSVFSSGIRGNPAYVCFVIYHSYFKVILISVMKY